MDRKSAPRTRTRAAMEFSSFRNAIGMYPEVNEGAFHLPGCRPPGSWLGPLVQTARQSFSISAGWTIRVYLRSKLWARDGRLRFIQTTCHEFSKHSGKL